MARKAAQMTSLDGRRFRPPDDATGGDVGTDTEFVFHQEDDLIWARYDGGRVRLGYLVGKSDGVHAEFRYTQLLIDGTTANGWSRDRIEVRPDGRVRLHEAWRWESKIGAGSSVLDEVSGAPGGGDVGELGQDPDGGGVELR
jgi:hypothetical protein